MKIKPLPFCSERYSSRRYHSLVVVLLLTIANVFAQDLTKVAPVTNKILMVSLDEGHVDYHDVYGQNASSIAHANAVNTTNAANKANYILSSTDDSNYATPKSPINLGRKAKPQDYVDLYASGTKVVLDHSVYIELPSNLVRGKTYTLTVNNLVQNRNTITFVYDEKKLWSPTIHVNQVGFVPTGVKYAYLSQWMGNFNAGVHLNGGLELDSYSGSQFQIIRSSDNTVVFTGTISKRKDKSTTETNNGEFGATKNFTNADVWECNFSGFSTPGQYYIAVDNIGRSHTFEIAESAYRHAYRAVSKAIFTQRQGVDKELEGGVVYPRGHHPDDRNVWFTGTTTPVNVWGYYYDAGDWDGHNRHIGVPMDLMLLYDFKAENFKDGDVGNRYRLSSTSAWINEGTDGLPDILNEAKWLVSFYKRAKDALIAAGKGTGGVIGGRLPNQNGVNGEGYIGPDAGAEGRNSWTDTRPVYVNAEEIANTFLYSGAAAYYAVMLNKFHGTVTTESNSWRTEAVNAYNWADSKSGDEVGTPNIKGKILGSACLYRLTGEVKYLNDLKRLIPMDVTYPSYDAWQRMETWHYAAMILGMCPSNHPNLDVTFQTSLKNQIISHADGDYMTPADIRGFRLGFNANRHTSNGAFSIPRMQMVAFAYEMTGDIKYLQQIQHTANYTLGGNENNMTYVSGLGHNPDEKTFHPDAWKLIDFNSKVYTNTIFPGYSNYYGHKDCDFFGCGFNFTGDEDYSRSLASPAISSWPAGEWRMNNKYSIAGSEFTMEETLSQTAFTYGYLSGNSSAAFTPNARPTVSLNFSENQSFPKAGCNLTVTSSSDTRIVKYYYDWHFIGESNDRTSNFAFFWIPPQSSGTTVNVTAVGYDDRGLITRPTDAGDRNLLISTSVSCSGGNVSVTGVTVSPTTATIGVGATQQLTATVAPANATNKDVTWSTTNAGVATVNSSGLVTGVGAGSATITVTSQDDPTKSATSAITVTTATPTCTAYEAETFSAQSGVVVATNQSGFTGTGFADFGGQGTYAQWNVSVPSSGTYTLKFRYGNGSSGNRQCALTANGSTMGNISFSPTANWSTWNVQQITATLNSGANTIRLTANTSAGGPNVDSYEICGSGTPDPTYTLTISSPNGTVTKSPNKTTYNAGETVILTATANSGYTFNSWSGSATGTTNPLTITMNSNKTITANFTSNSTGGCVAYQAESGYSGSGVTVVTGSGSTGSGFLDYGGQGTYAQWTVSVPAAGTYTFKFRYSNGSSGNRQCALSANGSAAGNISFGPTTGWATWSVQEITASLNSGSNTIRLTANTSAGGPNLDSYEVCGSASMQSASADGVEWADPERQDWRGASFNVFPNPVNNEELNVTLQDDLPGDNKVVISLIDAIGRKSYSRELGMQQYLHHVIDCSRIPNGVYLVRVERGHRQKTAKVIIK